MNKPIPIQDLINLKPEQTSSPKDSQQSRASRSIEWKRIEQVLVRLGVIYGHLFSSQFKTPEAFDAAVTEWSDSIGHYTFAKLTRAINRCKEEYKKPPSLPEFMELFKYTQEQALNAGHLDDNTPKLEHTSKYKDGVSPARELADSIVTHKEVIEKKPIKIMNDVEWEKHLLDNAQK